MKALYTMDRDYPLVTPEKLVSYNYDTRYQALKDGYKFVHLVTSAIDDNENINYEYYSTMQLKIKSKYYLSKVTSYLSNK